MNRPLVPVRLALCWTIKYEEGFRKIKLFMNICLGECDLICGQEFLIFSDHQGDASPHSVIEFIERKIIHI